MTMRNHPEIAIVGAGPAGLTAAVVLNNHGFAVRIYERDAARDARGQGGTLDLHDDGGQVALRHAGLLEGFRAIARHEDQETRDVDPISGALKPSEGPDEAGADRPEIDRGALRALLLEALPETLLRWNHALLRVEAAPAGRHRLVFAQGQSVEADIVIGADGAFSRVRAALSPVEPAYSGVTFFEGWLETPTPAQAAYVGHGTLFAFGGPEALFAQRNGQGRLCLYAAIQGPLDAIPPGSDLREAIGARYAPWAAPLRDLLASCPALTARPIYQLPADFEWAPQPGLLLVGDAAHLMPPVGAGVNLAMLDAADLALAIVGAQDWQTATQDAQQDICRRARAVMEQAVPGFAQWFSAPRTGSSG